MILTSGMQESPVPAGFHGIDSATKRLIPGRVTAVTPLKPPLHDSVPSSDPCTLLRLAWPCDELTPELPLMVSFQKFTPLGS